MHSRLSCPSASDHCAAEKWFKSVPYPIETMWRSLLVGQWYYFRAVGKVVNNKAKAIKRRSERRTLRNTEISSLTGSFILMVRLFRTQKNILCSMRISFGVLLQSWKRWENPKMRRNKNINSNKNMINNFLTGVMNINHVRCSSLEYGAVKTKTERALLSLSRRRVALFFVLIRNDRYSTSDRRILSLAPFQHACSRLMGINHTDRTSSKFESLHPGYCQSIKISLIKF